MVINMGNNILVGLSGGPSAAINSSLAGVISAAKSSPAFDKIYGAKNGISGVLENRILDLEPYSDERSLKLLEQTPAMALGSCRKKLDEEDFQKVAERFEEYGIVAFFYIGGNDSMDTVLKLDRYFKERGIKISIIGIPKTIDNDLPVTDHTPGYGSASKYLYHTMHEIIRDSSIYPVKSVVIVEVMGRDSGWLTLAAGLPRFLGQKAPHIIALPETPFDEAAFLNRVKKLLETERSVICAISEGVRDVRGRYIGESTKSGAIDSFGHTYLSGVGKYLEMRVNEEIGCKVRSVELNVMQRCASHLASKTDIKEARAVGEKAVEAAVSKRTGVMMVLTRSGKEPYSCTVSTTDVANVACKAKDVPAAWLDVETKAAQSAITAYLLPLIEGDIYTLKDETGLPLYLEMPL